MTPTTKNYRLVISSEEYKFKTYNREEIFKRLAFANDDKRIGYDIINVVEEEISKNVDIGYTVAIPYFGAIRKNLYKTNFNEAKAAFSEKRKNSTLAGYRFHVSMVVDKIRDRVTAIRAQQKIWSETKQRNKALFIKLCNQMNQAYANAYIRAITLLKEVPFDAEWEEHYQSLKD